MQISIEMYALLGLLIKHLIVDFPLQRPYQYLNKGTYGHPGGIIHAVLHGTGTLLVFLIFAPTLTFGSFWLFLTQGSIILMPAVLDTLIHYHIDWAKVNVNKKYGWGPTTHEEFWWLLGLDQFLHPLTYWWLVVLFI